MAWERGGILSNFYDMKACVVGWVICFRLSCPALSCTVFLHSVWRTNVRGGWEVWIWVDDESIYKG